MKIKLVIVSIVAVLLMGGSTFLAAETVGPFIRANVPFEFRVDDQLMPSGQYQIVNCNTRFSLLIRAVDSKPAVLVSSRPYGNDAGVVAKLIFHRYGNVYFLRQVWIPGTNASELFESKAEVEYASRGNGPTRITLLASVGK